MKYPLSDLKHKLNYLGVFNVRFLEAINNNYTNDFDLKANQSVGANEFVHKINALTLHDGLTTLLERAEKFKEMVESITPLPYASPDTSARNMIGHLKDGNVELVKDAPV